MILTLTGGGRLIFAHLTPLVFVKDQLSCTATLSNVPVCSYTNLYPDFDP